MSGNLIVHRVFLNYHKHSANTLFIDIYKAFRNGSDEYRMASFSDEHMERLFEKFILEYYKEHHSYLNEIKAGQIKWNLEGDNEETMIKFLPVMQSDVMLRMGDRVLIIDAKYYEKSLRKYYDKHSLHSANLYQIFSYVKNHDRDNSGQVSGLLLYAKTSEDIAPDASFNMGGNIIGARTLDLNVDFSQISSQLDNIIKEFLINPIKERA
ncbi:MAG: hypothetical protein GXZ11_08840 [Tissierellia bacterium]|nr:hypothetical protein [Tissierellia bacterium]